MVREMGRHIAALFGFLRMCKNFVIFPHAHIMKTYNKKMSNKMSKKMTKKVS